MSARPAEWAGRAVATLVALVGAVACGSDSPRGPVEGADVDRPAEANLETVRFDDVATAVGIDHRHGAFRFGSTGDPFAMMGGGMCWIDADDDGWLDLVVVDTWTDGEWGRWREEGGLPTTTLHRNVRGTFTDAGAEFGVELEVRGSGCVAADLDRDGFTDLYVTTERENVLLWNDGGRRFVADDGRAGVDAYGWHAGAAVGDVNGDGWPDLFVAGYADLNRPVPGATRGFPNPFEPEPDLLYLSTGAEPGERPTFVDVAAEAGIEADRVDYGLGAVWNDVDLDGDLDLHVANDTQPNRLYVNEPADAGLGFRLVDRAPAAGVDDTEAGMGVAVGDYDRDGRSDLVVTNLARQGHGAFRSVGGDEPWSFEPALDSMDLPDLGQERTGWGTTWVDVDLDGDLDLLVANGAIPVGDLAADRDQLELFRNLTAEGERGRFVEATELVGLDGDGVLLGRGLAAADYDNDGDPDLAVGTIGGQVALLRNSGAGGHWLTVEPEPSVPGTRVIVTGVDGVEHQREILAGSSYLSSEDPRLHVGLGADDRAVTVQVVWPDGRQARLGDVEPDRLIRVEPDR